jgi:hypothetical protein
MSLPESEHTHNFKRDFKNLISFNNIFYVVWGFFQNRVQNLEAQEDDARRKLVQLELLKQVNIYFSNIYR